MAQAANLVAFDGNTTPASRTFTHEGSNSPSSQKTVSMWRESGSTNPLYGQPKVIATKESLKSGVVVLELDVQVPIMEVPVAGGVEGYTSPPKVAYTERFVITRYAHPRSTTVTARLARQLAVNLANGVATSVTPVAAGQVPEMFDLCNFPT